MHKNRHSPIGCQGNIGFSVSDEEYSICATGKINPTIEVGKFFVEGSNVKLHDFARYEGGHIMSLWKFKYFQTQQK